jgi:hypothetical protein
LYRVLKLLQHGLYDDGGSLHGLLQPTQHGHLPQQPGALQALRRPASPARQQPARLRLPPLVRQLRRQPVQRQGGGVPHTHLHNMQNGNQTERRSVNGDRHGCRTYFFGWDRRKSGCQ